MQNLLNLAEIIFQLGQAFLDKRKKSPDESARVRCICHIAFVTRLDALDWNLIIRPSSARLIDGLKHPPCINAFDKHESNSLSKYYSGGGLKFPPLIQRARHTPFRGLGGARNPGAGQF